MAYSSKTGRRPDESASKSSHSHIINDDKVKEFLDNCEYPKSVKEIDLNEAIIHNVQYPDNNPIDLIIAVDGGYSTVPVKKTFPSSQITFFQFGELLLRTEDLDSISDMPFISREAMSKLKELERKKLVLPTKNVAYKNNLTFTHTVRNSIYDFFKGDGGEDNLLPTLYWLIFELYSVPINTYNLSQCPYCSSKNIELYRNDFDVKSFKHKCSECDSEIFLTDVFRLHEAIDDELGAGGILGYLTNLIEQIIIIHTIKYVMENKPDFLNSVMFIKDGPLSFPGQTANMHKPFRRLCNYLIENHNLFIAGLEKSGAFVEHADEIKNELEPGQCLLLDNKYIYSYILPGPSDTPAPYASTSYYSSKLIFKSFDERMYVITLPVENASVVMNPQKSDFKNLDTILWNIEKLRCDMYDNAIIPVALANKLISLSNHPSSIILEKFAKKGTR